jgi:hypothetical protein
MAWPTTSNPRTNFVTVRFTDDETDDLDTYLGSPRSDAIRDAVARAVAIEKRRRNKKALVAGEEVSEDEAS